ncbi:MAG: hypothetical protein ABIB71_03225 [Candidatus Woesearchaeota archaeon]
MHGNISEGKKGGYMCAQGCCADKDAGYMGQVSDEDYLKAERNGYATEDLVKYAEALPKGIEAYVNFNPGYGTQGMMQNPMQDNMAYMLAAMFVAQYMDSNKGEYTKMVGETLLSGLISQYMGGLESRLSKPEKKFLGKS